LEKIKMTYRQGGDGRDEEIEPKLGVRKALLDTKGVNIR